MISQTRAAFKFSLPEYLKRQSFHRDSSMWYLYVVKINLSRDRHVVIVSVISVSGNVSRYAAERIYKKAPEERRSYKWWFKVYSEIHHARSTDLESTVTASTLSLNFLACRGEGSDDALESFIGVFSHGISLLNEQRWCCFYNSESRSQKFSVWIRSCLKYNFGKFSFLFLNINAIVLSLQMRSANYSFDISTCDRGWRR